MKKTLKYTAIILILIIIEYLGMAFFELNLNALQWSLAERCGMIMSFGVTLYGAISYRMICDN